jgi:plasmid maintenance system antidote protein VapI
VHNRISNGDFSERALARILRVSQPQIHNVLKGVRKLTPELADRMLRSFEMSVLDLLDRTDLDRLLDTSTSASPEPSRKPTTPVATHVQIRRFPPQRETHSTTPRSAQQPLRPAPRKSA